MQIVGRTVDGSSLCSLVVSGGDISALSLRRVAPDDHSLPWIAPGFVDIQVNGAGGVEFSSADLTVDAVEGVCRILAAHGVTHFLPTVVTQSDEVIEHGLATIDAACRASPVVAAAVWGVHLEGPYLSPEDGPRGAHAKQFCRPPNWEEFQRWQKVSGGRIQLVTLAPEHPGSPEFISAASAAGVRCAIGHTAADDQQLAAAVAAGAVLSTHLGNGAHPRLRRHPNYIWAQLADDRLSASLIGDGCHLPPSVLKSFIRGKEPHRCILVSDLSGMAGLPPGRYETNLTEIEILDDGRIVVAGQRELLAAASRGIHWGVALAARTGAATLAQAVDMATANPARLLGRPAPTLELSGPADFILFHMPEGDGPLDVVQVVRSGATIHGDA